MKASTFLFVFAAVMTFVVVAILLMAHELEERGL